MFCSKCGMESIEGAVFCQKCGAKIPVEDTVEDMSIEADSQSLSASNEQTVCTRTELHIKLCNGINGVFRFMASKDKYDVLIDGIKIGHLAFGESMVYNVTLGAHDVAIGSYKIWLDIPEGNTPITLTTHIDEDGKPQMLCDQMHLVVKAPQGSPPSAVEKIDIHSVWSGFGAYFKGVPIYKKVLISLSVLMIAGVATLILVALIRLVFSSVISVIVSAALGYIAYHKWGAVFVTGHKYNKSSKELQLPDGITSQTLLEALSGKFNYPYFQGIRYGENGECIIEGKHSIYAVEFDENSKATLACNLNVDDKKLRATMLEAIAIRSYINKFFNPALPFDAVKDLKVLKSAERQRKTIAFVLSVASTLIIIAIALEYALPGSLQRLAKPGIEVRDAYLTEYSETVTVEQAFNNFFANEKWSTYESEGYSYVVVTGSCEFMGEQADTRLIFKITGEQFRVDSLDVNGQKQGDLVMYSLLSKVYEDYEEE